MPKKNNRINHKVIIEFGNQTYEIYEHEILLHVWLAFKNNNQIIIKKKEGEEYEN